MSSTRWVPSREVSQRTLDEIYRGPAWHGPAVVPALRGLTALDAAWRPGRGRNTIWELVLHLAIARHRMILRLGGTTPRFPRGLRSSWWARVAEGDERAWRADRQLLDAYQDRLLDAVAHATDKILRRRRTNHPRSIADEVLGIAVHDAY